MCIICNGGHDDAAVEAAERFLKTWERAQIALDEAARAMRIVSTKMPNPDDRKRYDHLHKRMVRVMRDWNRLEQIREAHPAE